jgi:hypothetical protein
VTDTGVQALASGCAKLNLIDLSKTSVTDVSVRALMDNCASLYSLNLTKCKNVSSKFKNMHELTAELSRIA